MTNLESRLHNALALAAADWVPFLQELVRTPSPVGCEHKAQRLVFGAMSGLDLAPRNIWTDRGSQEPGPCVVGVLPGSGRGGAFLLNAHIDTAPVEFPTSWTHPPFGAEIDAQNRLHGRGSLDDKAGVAMLLLIADALRREGVALPGDLVLASVVDDECSGEGTRACTDAGFTCDAGIVIDGTWPFRIIDAHLGQLWLELEFQGIPAAACSLRRGRNPIDAAVEALGRIRQEIDALNIQTPAWEALDSPYFCNAGMIRAGAWPGSVPERCVLELQVGFPPPETPVGMLARIRTLLTEMEACGSAVCKLRAGTLQAMPFANRANPVVEQLAKNIARLRPGEMEVRTVAVTGHCDLAHLRRADGSLAAACLYGPGGGGNPHARDEFYMLDHFVPVAQNIVSTLLSCHGIL